MGRARWLSIFVSIALGTAALLLATLPVPASATGSQYYVGASNCSDGGPGTQSTPWCTINHATQTMVAGDTTFVMSGTYTENVAFRNSGTASAPITLRALLGARPILANSTGNAISVSSRSYIVIAGLTIQTPVGNCIVVSGGGNNTVTGVICTGAGRRVSGQTDYGIRFTSTSGGTIANSTSFDNSDAGIAVTGTASAVRVVGNHLYANARGYTRAAPGIDIRATGGSILVEKNISHDNEDTGIQVYSGPVNTVLRNNLTYHNGDHGIDNLNSSGTQAIGNTVYLNCTAGINFEGSGTSNVVAKNNISMDNGNGCPTHTATHGNLRADSSVYSTATFDSNLVYQSTSGNVMLVWNQTSYISLAAFQSATGQEVHGLQGNPGFVSSSGNNFHLQSSSLAIDSANSGATNQSLTDLENATRYDYPVADTGIGPRKYDDRGAYELHSTSPASPTPVPTLTATPSKQSTPSRTATKVPTPTLTTGPTSTATKVPVSTLTATPSRTATKVPTPTLTTRPTSTPTKIPTPTKKPTSTPFICLPILC